jgi:hypothetical protein
MAAMKYRKLRIASSVGWGVLCLPLIALWARSYSRCYAISGHFGKQSFTLQSSLGEIYFVWFSPKAVSYLPWEVFNTGAASRQVLMPKRLGFDARITIAGFDVGVSHWLPILFCTAGAIAPLLPWRFSLRTLLIAITVVAVLLGLAIWAAL